ncbi:MAG: cation:proton antiporter [Desulfobacterales bacterium]|jgi:multicomponent Na+:H+ antiporter subunit F
MNLGLEGLMELISRLGLGVLMVSIGLAFIRVVRGPQAADRVAALDLISILIVAFLAAYAIYSRETSYLDVAIAYALVAFLGTVALCRFLLRSHERRSPGPPEGRAP